MLVNVEARAAGAVLKRSATLVRHVLAATNAGERQGEYKAAEKGPTEQSAAQPKPPVLSEKDKLTC
ncbi:MAG: hypothetical protein Q8R82_19690 [Hyphomonadaceae bacterium]|nr:hypothetical protein [Hyphomonadaceae bacterium]